MPSYSISTSSHFDQTGPFDRPLIRMVVQSVDEVGRPAPPLTSDPGDQWLCLILSMLGGRAIGMFGQAAVDDDGLAVLVRSTGTAVATLAKWIKSIRKTTRHIAPNAFVQIPIDIWMIPRPFPHGMQKLLADVNLLKDLKDPLQMVNEEGVTFHELLDPLFDLGAMYWRLFPGHQKLQLDTRFVGPKDLQRHLMRVAEMAGVDIWEGKA